MALLGGKWETRGAINDGGKGNWKVGTKEVNDGLRKRDRRLLGGGKLGTDEEREFGEWRHTQNYIKIV